MKFFKNQLIVFYICMLACFNSATAYNEGLNYQPKIDSTKVDEQNSLVAGIINTSILFKSIVTGGPVFSLSRGVTEKYYELKRPQTVQIELSKDAILIHKVNDDIYSNGNYGTSTINGAIMGTQGGVPRTFRSLMYVDLSTIPAGEPISSAKLFLFGKDHSQNGGTNESELYEISTTWDESTVTWNSLGFNQSGSTRIADLPVSLTNSVHDPTKDYEVDLLSYVLSIRNTTNAVNVLLKLKSETMYTKVIFYSTEATDPADRPYLEVVYGENTSNAITFLFEETNSYNGNLNYTLLDQSQDEVLNLPTVSGITYGQNIVNLDLTTLNLNTGEFYTLIVTDSNDENYYLKFIIN